ncbi:MAG: YdjY domain-containing protein, partial [Thermoguttaceae bacterium]
MTGPFDRYRHWAFLSLLLSVTASVFGQENQDEPPAQYGDRPKNAAHVEEIHRANLSQYKDVADILVLPGLIARKKEQRVEILAEATGLAPDSIVEFLLIGSNSGKGYESLLWSFAKPSDVHKALVFIGMKPGKPLDPARLRFWPKGERVLLNVAARDEKDDASPPVRLECLVMDRNLGESLPEDGFVFTGSFLMNGREPDSGRVYAADVVEPKSVASLYNDPIAVLDVPRRARKSDIYGSLVIGPEYGFAKNELLTIRLEPEYKDGRQRVMDLVLEVRRPAETAMSVEFLLKDGTGKAIVERPELPLVLGKMDALITEGHDPYVSVRFDAALRLAEVRKVCRIIGLIDTDSGIRVEPPETGQLYYEALVPDPQWLDRENRIDQPWELHLVCDESNVTGTLILYESTWSGDHPDSQLKVTTLSVETPKALRS